MTLVESGILIVALGAVIGYLGRFGSKLLTYVKTKCLYSIQCNNDNVMFHYLETWIDQGEYIKRCKNVSLKYYNDRCIKTLGYGLHVFKHNGVRFLVYKYKEEAKESFWTKEVFTAVIFTRKLTYIESWLEEIEQANENAPYKYTKVFLNKLDTAIEKPIVSREPTLETTVYNKLTNDIGRFLSSEAEYNKLGIPYKRGYLLFGPPGNGKTTTILCIAQKFKKHVKMLSLSEMSNEELIASIANLGKNTILVLEDIDCIDASKTRVDDDKQDKNMPVKQRVTLNVLLNCLDGLLTRHGMITFATTNHIEKLDPALIRAGRMDFKQEFKNASYEQAERYFQKFFPNEDATEFAHQFDGRPMCELEGYMLERLNEA